MHPRIAERRAQLAEADPLAWAARLLNLVREALYQGRDQMPGEFWDTHIDTVEVLQAAVHGLDPDDPMLFVRLQILSDAMSALQIRIHNDLESACRERS